MSDGDESQVTSSLTASVDAQEKRQDAEARYGLITRHLQEVSGGERLLEILRERDIRVYWGTAPTGKPHFGYFVGMLKIADFLAAGCSVVMLFANIHGFLDSMKTTWELLDWRTEYYQAVIKQMLRQIGVPLDRLSFVKGTDFQLSREYTLDVYKMSAIASSRDTQHAGAEVVKQSKTPRMSGLLYPILQSLDEQYLDVDAQFGGVDQRKIFMFAKDFLPKIGYKSRVHLMNPLIPGLVGKGGKMSASVADSKIDFMDDDDVVREKIRKAFSADGKVEGNGLLAILRHIVFRFLEIERRAFKIDRDEKWGGNVEYFSYEELEKDFVELKLASVDLKAAIVPEIVHILRPMREFLSSEQNLKLQREGYPQPPGK